MAYCFYNGVKLPELPSTAYPYCWIRKNDNTQHYDLVFTKVVGYYDASAGGIVYGANAGTTEIAHYRVAYADAGNADSWENYQTTNTWMALDANRTVMWSNHYIPNGSLTATEMYFDGYEAIPEVAAYQIEKDTVVGIADQVRRLCKTEATMTPAQMESKLGDLNIELTELYVTSTAQDVTYTPEEGYYGFSKVVVGGVDPGGGGGGSGGGGGEVITYPSADGITFGTEAITEEVETGRTIYGTAHVPHFPGDNDYPYYLLYQRGNYYHMECYEHAPSEISKESYGYYVFFSEEYTGYRDWQIFTNLSGGFGDTWESKSGGGLYPTSVHQIYAEPILWTNFTVTYSDGAVEEFGEPEPETETVTTDQPLDRDESYLISGEDLNSIIGIAQKVTGTTKPMTVEEATKALTDYGVRPSAEEEGF